jgi:hypothetical protein
VGHGSLRYNLNLPLTFRWANGFVTVLIMSQTDKQTPPKKIDAAALAPDSEIPPDADLEERFNDFWKRNASSIFGAIALGAVLVVGIQGYQFWQGKQEQAVQAAYLAATTADGRLLFADQNPKHQLAGLALLQVADERFANGDYSAAADLYTRALAPLAKTTLAPRVKLGHAASRLLDGDTRGGQTLLQAIVNDTAALDQVRGEAAYHLAVSYWEAGDLAGARAAIDQLTSLENAGYWRFQGASLEDRIPGLPSGNR